MSEPIHAQTTHAKARSHCSSLPTPRPPGLHSCGPRPLTSSNVVRCDSVRSSSYEAISSCGMHIAGFSTKYSTFLRKDEWACKNKRTRVKNSHSNRLH